MLRKLCRLKEEFFGNEKKQISEFLYTVCRTRPYIFRWHLLNKLKRSSFSSFEYMKKLFRFTFHILFFHVVEFKGNQTPVLISNIHMLISNILFRQKRKN